MIQYFYIDFIWQFFVNTRGGGLFIKKRYYRFCWNDYLESQSSNVMVAVEELENQILNTTKNLRKTKAQPSGDAFCNNISSTKKKSIKYHKELNKLINAKF